MRVALVFNNFLDFESYIYSILLFFLFCEANVMRHAVFPNEFSSNKIPPLYFIVL